MSSINKAGEVPTVEDFQLLFTEVKSLESKKPTDEQIERMRLPELLELKGQLDAHMKGVEAKLRGFYDRLREHFSHTNKRTLGSVESKITEFQLKEALKAKVQEVNAALKPLISARNIQPLSKKLEELFDSYQYQDALLEYLKSNHAQLASLIRDFADSPLKLMLHTNCCHFGYTTLTPAQAEILTFLPPVELSTMKSGFTAILAQDLRGLIPKMNNAPSLNLQYLPYPEVRQFYSLSPKVTHILTSVDVKETSHIKELIESMPQLKILELNLSGFEFASWQAATAALKSAQNLEELHIDCRWARCHYPELDVSDILANLPTCCKKVTISQGKVNPANPALVERFTNNKLEELKLYKCSPTLNNPLLAKKISTFKELKT